MIYVVFAKDILKADKKFLLRFNIYKNLFGFVE